MNRLVCFISGDYNDNYLLHIPNIYDQVDEERQRISLGMKNSYMRDEPFLDVSLEQESAEPVADETKSIPSMNKSLLDTKIVNIEDENDQCPIFSQAEARASVLPLDVTVEDFDESYVNNSNNQNQEQVNEDNVDEKQKRRARKKAKEERFVHACSYLVFVLLSCVGFS